MNNDEKNAILKMLKKISKEKNSDNLKIFNNKNINIKEDISVIKKANRQIIKKTAINKKSA